MNIRYLAYLLILLLTITSSQSQTYQYNHQELCDGFPALNIGVKEGLCIGLVLSEKDTDPSGRYNLLNPRKIIQLPNDDFIVTDLGQWTKKVGRIWRLRKNKNGEYKIELLFRNLPFPHGIAIGKDGQVYVGLENRIARFNPENPDILEDVIKFPKPDLDQLHPLKEFIFDVHNNIIVQNGSLSDHCEEEIDNGVCQERNKYGVLLKYQYQNDGTWSQNPSIIAKGLRNAAALLLLPDQKLLAAESSTDFRDENFSPVDELNFIHEGEDYGWPYYVGNEKHPEWENITTFKKQTAKAIPLEPHSTPLGLTLIDASSVLNKSGVLVSFHGYEESGAKISFFPLPYNDQLTLAEDIITDWSEIKDIRPHGAPVGMTQAKDGSIWIVDDRNTTILRLSLKKSSN